jgi:suppressor for copper-sensitivity B
MPCSRPIRLTLSLSAGSAMNYSIVLRTVLVGTLCLAGIATSAGAAESGWVGDQRGKVRLIAASDSVASATLEAGLEFAYPPGWHGYWRTPGDTGIAAAFDWSRSANLRDATVSWPAPSRRVISGLQNSVYEGTVILPVSLKLIDGNTAARIAVSVDYAVCSDVCVPKHADLSLDLPLRSGSGSGGGSAQFTAIAAARERVPGRPADSGIKVTQSELKGTGAHQRLFLTLRSSGEPFRSPDVFVEGAGEGLPPAPRVRLSDNGRVARLVVSLPSTDLSAAGRTLMLTVVDGARSVEFAGPGAAHLSSRPDSGRGKEAEIFKR